METDENSENNGAFKYHESYLPRYPSFRVSILRTWNRMHTSSIVQYSTVELDGPGLGRPLLENCEYPSTGSVVALSFSSLLSVLFCSISLVIHFFSTPDHVL